MITCGVCGSKNDDLSVVCSTCKGFLQGRTDALDLFATVWGLVENPRETMRRIVLAKHKNYVLLLSALAGIYLVLEIAWYKSLASVVPDILLLLVLAIVAGPVFGWFLLSAATVVLLHMTHAYGGRGTTRNLFAALSYSTVPLVAALWVIVPLQFAVFGVYFFGSNPPPLVIKPVEYVLILGIKGVLALYAFYLGIEGTMVANGLERRNILLAAASLACVVVTCGAVVHFVKI